MQKAKYIFFISIVFVICANLNIIISSLSPNLPKKDSRPILYSNQMRQDLKMTTIKALKKAKKSIHLVMYGISDIDIINTLKKKSEENIPLKVFIDNSTCYKKLDIKPHQLFKVKSKGLMHQKILILDNSLVFLGSANMTPSSLMMHDNLMIGFHSFQIARFLQEKTPYYPGHISTNIADQKVEIFLLPDSQNAAIDKIRNLIDKSNKKIEIAMFTFTHQALIDSLINAKKRNVDVKLSIDSKSKNGASKKAIGALLQAKIKIYYNLDNKLCHHKYILIDDKTLICGSANWTKSAFKNNYDCFMVLYNLDNSQKKFMKKLWKTIRLESSLL